MSSAAGLAGAAQGMMPTPPPPAPAPLGSDPAAATQPPGVQALRWLVAWAVALMLLSLLNRTRLGHTAIYYALVLCLVLLLATQYRWFASVFEPITGKTAGDYTPPQPQPAAHSWNLPQIAQSESGGISAG